jgi:molybdopterin-guanine dinucleotide biosynthesis protein A
VRNALDARGLNPAPDEATTRRSLLIFAGGRATRLGGTNKALLEVDGLPIVQRILRALGPLVDERVVLTNDDALRELADARLVFDPEPHAGVLPALAAGLEAARGEVCLAVACDMPFVSRGVFEAQLGLMRTESADVVIPASGDNLEPMHAVYRRQPVLAAIRAALRRGERRMISYFGSVRVRQVADAEWRQWDASGTAFFNVNTPDDLAEARRIAGAP